MGRLSRLAALVLLMIAPAAAKAGDWRAFETAHFIIYSKSDDQRAERLATRLETIDGLMRMASGISDKTEPVKVRIYEVGDQGEVQAAMGPGADSGIGGFYTSNILGPYAVTPRSTTFHDGDFTPELVLHHEYAHHFMLQYFPAVYPQWYVEGWAELIGSSKIEPDGKVDYGMSDRERGHNILDDWVPLQDVFVKPPEKLYGLDPYGQGWAMTHFFTFSNQRAAQLRAYLHALNIGKPPAEAASVFGDLGQLNRDARTYVTTGTFIYKQVAVPIAKPVIQSVRPVSAGEAALIPETIAFDDYDLANYRKDDARERERKWRETILQRIRDKVRLYPADPFALYLLAQAEYSSGNFAQSEAAADRLLSVDPNHVRGLVIKSLNVARAAASLSGGERLAKAQQARQLAVRANHGDPNDPLPLLAFYQSYHLAGLKPIPEAVDDLVDVSLTLPDNSQVRQLLVDEYVSEKKWALAISALAPIANDPHDTPLRAAAREQIARLVAALQQEQGTTPKPDDPPAPPSTPPAKP